MIIQNLNLQDKISHSVKLGFIALMAIAGFCSIPSAWSDNADDRRWSAVNTPSSLKATSSVVLTYSEFQEQWSKQTKDAGNFHNVSLQEEPVLKGGLAWSAYLLKAGDVISIQLLGHPELSGKSLLVTPDGMINLPLVGLTPVSGIGIESLQQELEQRFKHYLRYPNVTITLDRVSSYQAYIMGAIHNPGSYIQDSQEAVSSVTTLANTRLNYRVTSLLAKAGGLLADADLFHIQVFNVHKNSCREVNLMSLLALGDLSQDMLLEPEDVVYVPRLPDKQWNHPEVMKLLASSNIGQSTYPVRVYGFVTRPDVYQLSPNEMTLQTALAKAGIQLDKAQRSRIYISRTMPNQRLATLAVDSTHQDTILYPNDVVIVSRSNWQWKLQNLTTSIFADSYLLSGSTVNIHSLTTSKGKALTP